MEDTYVITVPSPSCLLLVSLSLEQREGRENSSTLQRVESGESERAVRKESRKGQGRPTVIEVMDPIANQRRFRTGNAETTVLDFMLKGEFEKIHERFTWKI